MFRWILMMLFSSMLATTALAEVEIVGMPDAPGDCYDLSWTLQVKNAPSGALVLEFEKSAGKGYVLRWEKGTLTWQDATMKQGFAPVTAPVSLATGTTVDFSIKRRPGTVAVLRNHRLLFIAPAPSNQTGTWVFSKTPLGCGISEARYRAVGKPVFGDDFMRGDTELHTPSLTTPWPEEDSIWRVAYYRKDDPGSDPKDPKTGMPMSIPWQLSSFLGYKDTTTNGFWYLYRGTGPSWVVANPTNVFPTWDQYYVEASVKPEYDSEVGLIAAYQDTNNYLLFQWKQRDADADGPRAYLIAVVDGERKVLATGNRGYEPSQWYAMRINLGWQTAEVLIDGQPLLSAQNPGPIEGRIGLYASGAEKPRRPKLDEVTASMYVSKDENGHVTNEAADALRSYSLVLFDDVRVGEWFNYQSTATASPYVTETTGKWKQFDNVAQASMPGTLITGSALTRYTAATRLRLPNRGSAALLFHLDDNGNGYAWQISNTQQKLYLVEKNVRTKVVDEANIGLRPDEWADLRAEADGPYVRLYFNSLPVLENFDENRTGGRCGLQAFSAEVSFDRLTVTQMEPPRPKPNIHAKFVSDKWLVAWSIPESDWYPAFAPKAYVTPAGIAHDQVGNSAPLPTNEQGLYWHKGGFFHDFRATLPLTPNTISGQTIYLAHDYDSASGYSVQLTTENGKYQATLMRGKETVGSYPFTLTPKSRMVFQRQGAYLIMTAQALDPEDDDPDPEVLQEKLVFAYRDAQPLKTEMIGFNVTTPNLAAAQLVVDSDRLEDPFEYAPTSWLSESGVWAVMARYSCQPQWNWFGGFGPFTPTVWNKYRLEGDQVVEAYIGIKMQYDNQPEEYARRYRDTNVTICADGSHLNSGYSVIRAGRADGHVVTMLLRKGVVVDSIDENTNPAIAPNNQYFLLPPQGTGHRRWFVTRIEKRGDTLKVFIDNRLAMTYKDPDPIPGGYAGIWTLNNGIMIGRANVSAEKMTLGMPRAAAPLAVQEVLNPLPMPQVTVNGAPVKVATFESGMEECKERPGLTARLVRERVTGGSTGTNTVLKIVNMYPAGDFSAGLTLARDLRGTPYLHFDYCFDPGATVNLYLRRQTTWYEVTLTGKPSKDADIYHAGEIDVTADGHWHHAEADLGTMLADAIAKQTNAPAADLTFQEMIVANWSADPVVRAYGFGGNDGGMNLRFDNIAFVPVTTTPLTVNWQTTGPVVTEWRVGADAIPVNTGKSETSDMTAKFDFRAGRYFFHLQGKDADGNWMPVLNVPMVVKEK